jgi:hypothetical protein
MAPTLACLVTFAASVSGGSATVVYDGSFGTFAEGAFGPLPSDAPAWCKEEADLTWKQRKERMEQHATLEWAKKQTKRMHEENETVPEWMDKLVSDDEKRGKMKWAVGEGKRLRAEGKEVPQWMADLEAEDGKWANRWAACKSAELKAAGDDVPLWMAENARKGIMDAAKEKAEELQEEIDELEQEKEEETALVGAQGDVTVASQKLLGRNRKVDSTTVAHQTHVLEVALDMLNEAESKMHRGIATSDEQFMSDAHKTKEALWKAKAASALLGDILDRKASQLTWTE